MIAKPPFSLAIFSAQAHDREYFSRAADQYQIEPVFFDAPLNVQTAELGRGFTAVCAFVNDRLDAAAVELLAESGVGLIALRCSGFNNVDLTACARKGVRVVRVPEYSPHAVAEHTFGLILALNRKIHKAFNRIREGDFSLDGLKGFDLNGKTLGLIGAGRIGRCVARIGHGFGCQLLIHDPQPDENLRGIAEFVSLPTLLSNSDIISLHCPLTPQTFHLINAESLALVKPTAMLVNTSRGALVDTVALIQSLKTRRLSSLAIDVYEEEADMFYHDLSADGIRDDVFARLMTFPNVLITGHQAFFTHEALTQIAAVTLSSVRDFYQEKPLANEVTGTPEVDYSSV